MSLPAETIELEALIQAHSDKGMIVDQLLKTVIVVPVDVQEGDDAGAVAPVTINHEGVESVVSFTTADGAEQIRDRAQNAMTISGIAMVLRIPQGLGLLLFSDHGNVAFDPALLQRIRSDIRAMSNNEDGRAQ